MSGGCSFCGYALGDCMSPGDDCPLAKKMQAPVTILAPPSPAPIPTDPSGSVDLEGVWVTWDYADGNPVIVAFFPDEVGALRRAVELTAKVKFLRWGEVL